MTEQERDQPTADSHGQVAPVIFSDFQRRNQVEASDPNAPGRWTGVEVPVGRVEAPPPE
jgi:hypothetical protein